MLSKRNELIKHLENDIYCRLGVNKNNEVGVMAIKNIPKGTDPFKTLTKNKYEINALKILCDYVGLTKIEKIL